MENLPRVGLAFDAGAGGDGSRWALGTKAIQAPALSAGTPAFLKYFCAIMSVAI